jgi:hypothetical protein
MEPVDHATPYRLGMADCERAVTLLESWSRDPVFRDPPEGGRA